MQVFQAYLLGRTMAAWQSLPDPDFILNSCCVNLKLTERHAELVSASRNRMRPRKKFGVTGT